MKAGFVRCAALLFLCVSPLLAANRGKIPARAEDPPPSPVREAVAPLLSESLHLSDFTGMQPRPGLREKLAHIEGFIQSQPKDGETPSEQTEVWMGYTRTTLYFVFICHDSTPGAIRSHLSRREDIGNDDSVSVLLDPFQDRRKGVMFLVNPAGVQADAAWSETQGTDFSYDQVWDSEGQINAGGWMALVAIPFRSLRFRPDSTDWGVVFSRSIPRNSESDNWPRIAANVSGTLSQEGLLRGISGVAGSHNLQLNPYALAQSSHMLNDQDDTNPFFSTRKFEGTVGGEAKLILHDSIVLDATVNPDFSDVESDTPQFTVNTRYSVYFPELRPFFLENANYFSTPINLLYTRNVGHPEYGFRATGKIGQTNLGLLAVDDRSPGEQVGPTDSLYKKRAKYFVGRVSQDLGRSSSVGMMYTDREYGDGWSRVGGADFTWRMNNSWTASGQAVESSTMGDKDDPSYTAGPAFRLDLSRQGHSFNFNTQSKSYSNGFGSQTGYIQTTDIYMNHTHTNYQWYPGHGSLQSWGLEVDHSMAWDHAYNRVYHYTTFDPYFLLKRNTMIAPMIGENSDTLGAQNDYNFAHNHNFTENFAGLMMHSSPWTQLSLSLFAMRSGNVNYNPPAASKTNDGLPFLMDQNYLSATVTVQPLNQLSVENIYLLDREHAAHSGQDVYESQTLRTKINYQFTQALSARVITEYQSTLVNPELTSLLRTKQISTQALFTWLPHPGTAIYMGYNNDLQNFDRSLCYRLSSGACDPDNTDQPRALNWLNDGRQFFIKASYLFRF
jgi:hypothetical protein